jgi:hypothetical protein
MSGICASTSSSPLFPTASPCLRPACMLAPMSELVFEVTQEADGGFVAECLTESIFTQGDTWQELRDNVREAVEGFYFDRTVPAAIRLHLVRDELVALG